MNNENYNVTYDDSGLKVSLTNSKYGDYSIQFNYADNKVTYNNDRDISSASEEMKYWYALCDNYFVLNFLSSVASLYQVDKDIDIKVDEYEKYGLNIVDEDINYILSDSEEIKLNTIKSLVFDLNKFNEATLDYQNTENSTEYYYQTRDLLNAFANPMSDKLSFDDIVSSMFENVIEQAQTEDGVESNNENNKNSSEQVVSVPSTGYNSMYIMAGIILCAISFGTIIYFIILKKG